MNALNLLRLLLFTCIVLLCFGCSDDDELSDLCNAAIMKYDNSIFEGTAIYCYELPLDTMQTTFEEAEIFVDFFELDSVSIEINYLDPLLETYYIMDTYTCLDPEGISQVDFRFEEDNYRGLLNSYSGVLTIFYGNEECSDSEIVGLLKE